MLRCKEGSLREGVRFWTIRWIAKVRVWPPLIGFAGQGSLSLQDERGGQEALEVLRVQNRLFIRFGEVVHVLT